jgi:hypothetical protein
MAKAKEKWCPRCKEYWPATVEFFWRNEANKDGLQNLCKACSKEVRHRPYGWQPEKERRAAMEAELTSFDEACQAEKLSRVHGLSIYAEAF